MIACICSPQREAARSTEGRDSISTETSGIWDKTGGFKQLKRGSPAALAGPSHGPSAARLIF